MNISTFRIQLRINDFYRGSINFINLLFSEAEMSLAANEDAPKVLSWNSE